MGTEDYRIRVYIRWTDLGESEISVNNIARQLKDFDAGTTLRLLGWVNQLVSFGESVEAEAMHHLLGPELLKKVARYTQRNGSPWAVLHRQQLLVAIRLAVLHCTEGGSRSIENEADRYDLGKVLLQINDHLGRDQRDTKLSTDLIDCPSDMSSALAATYLLSNHQQFEMYTVRYQKLLFEFVPKALEERNLPTDLWQSKYKDKFGAELEKVWSLSYQLCRLVDWKLKASPAERTPTSFEVANGHSITVWSEEEYASVLQVVASTLEQFKIELSNPSSLPFDLDFEAFRRKPFIRLGNDIVCVDRGFVLEFLGEQTLWRVRESFTPAEGRDWYGAILGRAVELYANWVLHSAFPESSGPEIESRLRTPRDIEVKAGHKVKNPDFEVQNFPVGQFFECKGILFTSGALFSNDGLVLGDELKRKLASRSGAKQLSAYMAWRMRFPEPGDPRRYQVALLMLDRALALPGVQSTLRKRAWEWFKEEWKAIDGLTGNTVPLPHISTLRFLAIGMDELEMLSAYVRGGTSLTDLLDAMLQFDPEGISPPKLGIDHRRYDSIADWRFLLESNPALDAMLDRNFRQ